MSKGGNGMWRNQAGAVGVRDGRRGEAVVHLLVGRVVASVEAGPVRHGVQQRPERAVREAVVVARELRLRDQDGSDGVVLAVGRNALAVAQIDAGPADPGAAALAQHGLEGRDQAAR
jgi:hypothetical protein